MEYFWPLANGVTNRVETLTIEGRKEFLEARKLLVTDNLNTTIYLVFPSSTKASYLSQEKEKKKKKG